MGKPTIPHFSDILYLLIETGTVVIYALLCHKRHEHLAVIGIHTGLGCLCIFLCEEGSSVTAVYLEHIGTKDACYRTGDLTFLGGCHCTHECGFCGRSGIGGEGYV